MLALVAGRGRLPVYLADRLEARGVDFRIFSLAGSEIDAASGRRAETFRIENLGSFLQRLQAERFEEVCFAGAIQRPALDPGQIDAPTLPLVPRMVEAIGRGDDGALRVVLELFEEHGLAIRAAHDIAPELLPRAGVATRERPAERHLRDTAIGDAVLEQLGRDDQGQACVIVNGREVAREDAAGTDAMLKRLAGQARGGILFKAPKPGQDRRVDLPTIGPQTVAVAHAAGLDGIVIAAGGVLVLDAKKTIEDCDRLGLFLLVREAV